MISNPQNRGSTCTLPCICVPLTTTLILPFFCTSMFMGCDRERTSCIFKQSTGVYISRCLFSVAVLPRGPPLSLHLRPSPSFLDPADLWRHEASIPPSQPSYLSAGMSCPGKCALPKGGRSHGISRGLPESPHSPKVLGRKV